MADWPGTLPQKLLNDGFTEEFQDNFIRQPMDVGPPKVRRRSTAAPRPIHGYQLLTAAQASALYTFYHTTVASVLPFNWIDPRSGSACVMRFKRPPILTAAGRTNVRATYELEILP